jgi:hypothetical protein
MESKHHTSTMGLEYGRYITSFCERNDDVEYSMMYCFMDKGTWALRFQIAIAYLLSRLGDRFSAFPHILDPAHGPSSANDTLLDCGVMKRRLRACNWFFLLITIESLPAKHITRRSENSGQIS